MSDSRYGDLSGGFKIESEPIRRHVDQADHLDRCRMNSHARCKVCRGRITVSPTDQTEYGHNGGESNTEDRCPHRPEKVDNTNPNGHRRGEA